jgi:hypothetical protein
MSEPGPKLEAQVTGNQPTEPTQQPAAAPKGLLLKWIFYKLKIF